MATFRVSAFIYAGISALTLVCASARSARGLGIALGRHARIAHPPISGQVAGAPAAKPCIRRDRARPGLENLLAHARGRRRPSALVRLVAVI